MRPTLIHAALDALDKPHVAGHVCADRQWYNAAAGTRTPCPVRRHVATAREQADRLHAQVHEAAHDNTAVRVVMQGMTGFTDDDLANMPAEDAEGWMHATRLAIEALSEHLDRDPVLDARRAAIRERLAAAGLRPDPDSDPADYGYEDLPRVGGIAVIPNRGPEAEVCRACGHVAIEHTAGRFSIYGVCPTKAGA